MNICEAANLTLGGFETPGLGLDNLGRAVNEFLSWLRRWNSNLQSFGWQARYLPTTLFELDSPARERECCRAISRPWREIGEAVSKK
jgi:hypothetical protein